MEVCNWCDNFVLFTSFFEGIFISAVCICQQAILSDSDPMYARKRSRDSEPKKLSKLKANVSYRMFVEPNHVTSQSSLREYGQCRYYRELIIWKSVERSLGPT